MKLRHLPLLKHVILFCYLSHVKLYLRSFLFFILLISFLFCSLHSINFIKPIKPIPIFAYFDVFISFLHDFIISTNSSLFLFFSIIFIFVSFPEFFLLLFDWDSACLNTFRFSGNKMTQVQIKIKLIFANATSCYLLIMKQLHYDIIRLECFFHAL